MPTLVSADDVTAQLLLRTPRSGICAPLRLSDSYQQTPLCWGVASTCSRWEGKGVIVESVQVQDVRYSDSITDAYANAQTAEIEKQRALNAQETAKVEAETKSIEAQGEADANAILTQSLTPEVLQQRYYETLQSIGDGGNLVLLPESSTPIVNTTK